MSITQFQDSIQDRLRVAVQASLPCQAAPVQLALGALLSAQQVPVHTLIACSLDEGEACLHVGAALDLVHIGLQRLHARVDAEPEQAGAAALLGTAGNVLAGDYLTSGSFKLLVHCGDLQVLEQVADAITRCCELECADMGREGTGAAARALPMGAAAAGAGAVLAGLGKAEQALARHYGAALAAALQAGMTEDSEAAALHRAAALEAAQALEAATGNTRPLELVRTHLGG